MAHSSNGLRDILRPVVSTVPAEPMRTRTLASTTRFTGARIFMVIFGLASKRSGHRDRTVFAGPSRTACEAIARVRCERYIGGLAQCVLREHLADSRRQLEAMPGETESGHQSFDVPHRSEHRVP